MEFIIKRRGLVLAFILVLSGLAAYHVAQLPVVTSIESLVRKDYPDRIFYSKFRKTFGADDAVVVAVGANNVFDHKVLGYIRGLTEKLQALEGVEDCLSLTSTETIRGLEDDFVVEPLFDPGPIPDDDNLLREARAKALSNPLIRGNLVNASANATLILVRTATHEDDQEFESRLLSEIEKTLSNLPCPKGVRGPYLAGWPVVDVRMAEYMNKDVETFVPISAVLMGATVFLFVGNWFLTALVMGVMMLSLLWTMAALKLVGGAMSPLTSILPPLIMALSLSDGIHITIIFLRVKDLMRTVREAWWPCALTSLTTAVGFLSLLVSDIPAIKHFGGAAAAGMGIELFLSFTFLVALVGLAGARGQAESTTSSRGGHFLSGMLVWLARCIVPFRKTVLTATVILVGIATWGMTRLEVDTNMLDYFYGSSDIRRSTSFVDSNLGGANTIEISLTAPEGTDFLEPSIMARVEQVVRWLEGYGGVTKITSPNSFLKLMNKAFHGDDERFYAIPTSRAMAAQYLLLYDGDELGHFMNDDATWARISARTNLHGTKELTTLYDALHKVLDNAFLGSGVKWRFSGKTYIFNHMAQDIVSSQIESLGLASVIIFGIMFLVLKSVRLGFISIVPNVIPILGNLGIMGLSGIPINTATAIISAVAIGIAVDDTIHFIVHFKRARDGGLPDLGAVQDAILKKGRAAISTSLVLVVGFGILVVSNFIPTAQFGVLSALIMLMALVADLLVLPVLLAGKRKRLR